jgi:hypothetical protein
LIGNLFDDDGVAHPHDLMDQAAMQAPSMRSQATFFVVRIGGAALTVHFALKPTDGLMLGFAVGCPFQGQLHDVVVALAIGSLSALT